VRRGFGFKYCIIDGGRTPSRREARMATQEMKRATEARKSLWWERERATVATAFLSPHGATMWGQGTGSGVIASTARGILEHGE
jgi:hypothetical protein